MGLVGVGGSQAACYLRWQITFAWWRMTFVDITKLAGRGESPPMGARRRRETSTVMCLTLCHACQGLGAHGGTRVVTCHRRYRIANFWLRFDGCASRQEAYSAVRLESREMRLESCRFSKWRTARGLGPKKKKKENNGVLGPAERKKEMSAVFLEVAQGLQNFNGLLVGDGATHMASNPIGLCGIACLCGEVW